MKNGFYQAKDETCYLVLALHGGGINSETTTIRFVCVTIIYHDSIAKCKVILKANEWKRYQ